MWRGGGGPPYDAGVFCLNAPAATEIYPLSIHGALAIHADGVRHVCRGGGGHTHDTGWCGWNTQHGRLEHGRANMGTVGTVRTGMPMCAGEVEVILMILGGAGGIPSMGGWNTPPPTMARVGTRTTGWRLVAGEG